MRSIFVVAILWAQCATALAADVRILDSAAGLPSNWISALAIAPDGKLWVGTGSAGLALVDPASAEPKAYPVKTGLPSGEVTSIAPFQGKVYVGTSAGLSVFDGSGWETVGKEGTVTLRNVRLSPSPDGKEMWAASVYLAGGTLRFDGKSWTFMGGEGRGLFNDVVAFAFTPEGVLLGTVTGAVYLHKGTDVAVLREGLPPLNVFSAAAFGGKRYLGTSRGLFGWTGGGWKEVSLPGEFAGVPVFSLSVRGDTLYAGTEKGIVRIEGATIKVLTAGSGLPRGKVAALAAGPDYLAAGTPSGLAIIRGW